MGAATLVLWRHGRTSFNAERRFQGQLDVDLDAVGRRQVAASAAELALLRPSAVVASDLRRAADTARALTERVALPLTLDPALREVHAGEWQGLTHEEISARWPDDLIAWRRGDDVRIGGGERRSEMAARAAEAIRRHAEEAPDGGLLVVAAHGAALKGALLRLLGLPLDSWTVFSGFANAHWAVLTRRGEGWTLAEYNVGPPGAGEGVEG
ncbi:putative phosphoglycerate mutase [Kineococcus xinjiangensis]|uniref:Putative phosphoglycerate mutase n=1 Tax=Kineococcus xinjiangensis TaxID=512762 RepID=A0A2S6IIW7_9ACTN|nr:histidine phosphatase family protein [Kineococcus xinjiangensis]PPK94159.1 putative phosphoglycerate mutase [Kineococcus xinjiangensis]